MTELKSSDIVQSLAGHDKGGLFYVLKTEGGHALIADGKLRKLSKPKRKKLKHLCFEAEGDPPVAAKIRNSDLVSDKEIRAALAIYRARCDKARGGN